MISSSFSSLPRRRSHTIYCVFSGDWGYSPTSRFAKNPVREFWAKSQGVYHLALLANTVSRLSATIWSMPSASIIRNSKKPCKKHWTLDIVHLRDLYRKVSAILGSEEPLEQINLLLRQRFMLVTPMAAFLQGLTNDLLYSLTNRDIETGRRAVQLRFEKEEQ